MTFRILLSENNETLRQMLSYHLEREGWEVTVFSNEDFPLLNGADCPNLYILDADGEEWFKIMREIQKSSNPIPIVLTSKYENAINRVWGFELGCADFIVKPFMSQELVFRIQRILDRREQGSLSELANDVGKLQDYHLDLKRRIVSLDRRILELTYKEFELLWFFSRHKGSALSREQILKSVWGENYFGSDRVVDDLIRRVRRKLTELNIETIYGYGYRIIS